MSGDFEGFIEHFKKAGAALSRAFFKLVAGLALMFKNLMVFIQNLIIDIGKIIVQGLLFILEKAINLFIGRLVFDDLN